MIKPIVTEKRLATLLREYDGVHDFVRNELNIGWAEKLAHFLVVALTPLEDCQAGVAEYRRKKGDFWGGPPYSKEELDYAHHKLVRCILSNEQQDEVKCNHCGISEYEPHRQICHADSDGDCTWAGCPQNNPETRVQWCELSSCPECGSLADEDHKDDCPEFPF